jgi:two-component system sensor kinase FixL
MNFRYLQGSTRAVLFRAAILTGLVALLDWRVDLNLSFGFLYLFPMLLAGTVCSRLQVLAAALACTLLSDVFDPFPFTLGSVPEDILIFSALAGTGLIAYETTRNRRREQENLQRVQEEATARREAEEQLEFLIGSSPAAILTMTSDCRILRANRAAQRLFGFSGDLTGNDIRVFIPALGRVPISGDAQTFRTEMQCRGERQNGDVFLANVFFSTYATAAGPRLAALIVDASEELRDREESSLEELLAGSRILVGAVSHEVRNVCGAIAVIHENLVRGGRLQDSQDFEALGALVETLHKIASLELKQTAGQFEPEAIDLAETLHDLRIVLEPLCDDCGIDLHWDIPELLPPVWGDRHRLLQVLLNLAKNSQRALETTVSKELNISVLAGSEFVSIRVADTGPGIATPEKLFLPFQRGAESTGLGLYLSRAFVRSFRGELRHDAGAPGCSFVIELAVALGTVEQPEISKHESHTTNAAR